MRITQTAAIMATLSSHGAIAQHQPQVAVGGPQTTSIGVSTTIEGNVATTRITQTLHNASSRIAEADWVLPLPADSLADRFTMTMGGQPVPGEVIGADKARGIYEAIVRKQRDPGLLEYYGDGCLRARVFPIPPGQSIDVVIQYRQLLPMSGSVAEWRFPLRAITGISGARLTLDATLRSRAPLKTVYSPLASIDIVRDGEHAARASLELPTGAIPENDLQLFFSTNEQAFGLDMMTHRVGANGYFLAVITPQHEWPTATGVSRVVQFVIDTSGSMKGKKIEQARAALRYFVQSLQSTDYFNVVPFSTEARPFFDAPRAFDPSSLADALARIDAIDAVGGTNIEDALTCALRARLPAKTSGRSIVPITVFLTDGQPTLGRTDPDALAKLVGATNARGDRIFVFGVGNSVNTRLLDRIAADSRGDRDYVREHEDIEVKTGALFTKLSNPVMTGLSFDVDGIRLTDRSALPDLFKGGRLIVLGRYDGTGQRAVRLRGEVNGVQREYVFEADFTGSGAKHAFVPALWAERRVALLLDSIRLNGRSHELVVEIERLGREFGIVTPFTSHLIVEEGRRVARARGIAPGAETFFAASGDNVRVLEEMKRAGSGTADFDAEALGKKLRDLDQEADASREALDDIADAPAAGSEAVRRSLELRHLRSKKDAARLSSNANDDPSARIASRRIGARTFHLVGGSWVDQKFVAAMHGNERQVVVFSAEYFALLRDHPDLAACFAFSERIVAVLEDGTAIETISR